jgi:NADPH2:quinone reductase
MRAVRLHRFGSPLQIDEVPEPKVGEGEGLLHVRFAGVNPVDVWLTNGDVAGGRQRLPFVPGSEAAGMLDGIPVLVHGAGLGVVREGMYAERAAVPRDAVTPLPEGTDLAQAAGLGVPGSTAWLLVHDVAGLSKHDRVLVLGATGGVGSLLAQLARRAGAVVWGHTSSPGKLDFVRSLTPDGAVVSSPAELARATSALAPTVVFDPLGDGYTDAAVAAVQPGGVVVLFGTSAGPIGQIDLRNMYKKGVHVRAYSATHTPAERVRAAITAVLSDLAAGTLHPFLDAVLPLEDAEEAHRRLRHREIRGKLLLVP